MGSHWEALHVSFNNLAHVDTFEIQYIQKQIKKSIGSKKIIFKFYRIWAYYSVMCGCFYTGFINFKYMGKRFYDRFYKFIFTKQL